MVGEVCRSLEEAGDVGEDIDAVKRGAASRIGSGQGELAGHEDCRGGDEWLGRRLRDTSADGGEEELQSLVLVRQGGGEEAVVVGAAAEGVVGGGGVDGGEVQGGEGEDDVVDVGDGGDVAEDGSVEGVEEAGAADGGHKRDGEVGGVVVEEEVVARVEDG